MSNAQINSTLIDQLGAETLTDRDRRIIDSVERFLADGLALKRWWERADFTNSYAERFPLNRTFNRPEDAYGFFDQVQLEHGTLPVMGNVQDMFYDQPRTPTRLEKEAAEWMRDQIREFVLHYWMRVSAFRQPEPYVAADRPAPPPYLERLSWCPEEEVQREGFGFSQHYYKLRETGRIGKFASRDEFAIVDLREIGPKYEWVVVKVRIYDFKFTFKPFGPQGLELVVPLTEESYLVLSREFILNETNASPDLLGEYGLGYAFIKDPTTGLIAYGPGQFRAAIETFRFQVLKNGKIFVRMVFVADRPERIGNVQLDPVDWGFRFADLFSFGLTSRLLGPLKDAIEMLPTSVGSFDPVYAYVSVVNALTANQAARQLCQSREQIERDFLVQHFIQHYQTMVGSLLTWRQIPNWLDSAALPEWVVTGKSS